MAQVGSGVVRVAGAKVGMKAAGVLKEVMPVVMMVLPLRHHFYKQALHHQAHRW